MAHVYGHADFFKHNLWFSKTNRKMMDEMANHATRVRRHIERQGHDVVERFIDRCLSLESLIDPHSMFMQRESKARDESYTPDKLPAKDYMDRFINPADRLAEEKARHEAEVAERRRKIPQRPVQDILLFLLRYAPLEDWQSDILSIVRDEAYYFAPQGMTKVMNEGWAVYWHSKLMTEHFVEAKEIIDYADQHSGVLAMAPGGFNPYKIGYELMMDIERRWDKGQHGAEWERLDTLGAREAFDNNAMEGRDKIFEVRRIYNDVSFIDEFLTPEFVDRHKMYHYRQDPRTGQMRIVSRDFDRIKQTLLYRLTNRGQPFIYAVDANYGNRGELFLAQKWNGLEVDMEKARDVLTNLQAVWGRPVHLQMRIEEDMHLLTCTDPETITKEKITDTTPAPANIVV